MRARWTGARKRGWLFVGLVVGVVSAAGCGVIGLQESAARVVAPPPAAPAISVAIPASDVTEVERSSAPEGTDGSSASCRGANGSAGRAPAYGWPVKPFHRQHPVRGYFGDPRVGLDPDGTIHRTFHSRSGRLGAGRHGGLRDRIGRRRGERAPPGRRSHPDRRRRRAQLLAHRAHGPAGPARDGLPDADRPDRAGLGACPPLRDARRHVRQPAPARRDGPVHGSNLSCGQADPLRAGRRRDQDARRSRRRRPGGECLRSSGAVGAGPLERSAGHPGPSPVARRRPRRVGSSSGGRWPTTSADPFRAGATTPSTRAERDRTARTGPATTASTWCAAGTARYSARADT